MKLVSWIKSLDIYAKNIQFTYRNKDSFSTELGGLISLIFIVIILLYGCSLLSIMFSKEFPLIMKTMVYMDNPLTLNIHSDPFSIKDESFYFPIAIGFQYEDQDKNISMLEPINPSIFNLTIQQKISSSTGLTTFRNLNFSSCKEGNFANFSEEFFQLNLNSTYCLNYYINLTGKSDLDYSSIEISVNKCINESLKGISCKPIVEIDQHFSNLKINLYYINSFINSTSSSNYITKNLRSMFWDIIPNYKKLSKISIEQTKLMSFDNYIPAFLNPFFKIYYSVDFDKNLDLIGDLESRNQIIWNLEIKSGLYSHEIKRFYNDIFTQISYLGGLSYVLIIIGALFAYISTEFWVDENLINEFYNIISPENNKKVKLSFEDFLSNVYNNKVRKFINEIIQEECSDKRSSVDSIGNHNTLIVNKNTFKSDNTIVFTQHDQKSRLTYDEKDIENIIKIPKKDTREHDRSKSKIQTGIEIVLEKEEKKDIQLKDQRENPEEVKEEIRLKEEKIQPLETLESLNRKEEINDIKYSDNFYKQKEASIHVILPSNNIKIQTLEIQHSENKDKDIPNIMKNTDEKDLLNEYFKIDIFESIYGIDKTTHKERIIDFLENNTDSLAIKETNKYDFRPLLKEILKEKLSHNIGEYQIAKIVKERNLVNEDNNLMILILEKEFKKDEIKYLKYKIFYDLLKYELNDKMYFTPFEIIKRICCFFMVKKKFEKYKFLRKVKSNYDKVLKQNLFEHYEKSVNLYKKNEIFEIGRKMLYRDIDLIRVLNTVKEFDRFKKIYFDEIQLNIFNTFTKKKISLDDNYVQINRLSNINQNKNSKMNDFFPKKSHENVIKPNLPSLTKTDFEENNEKNDRKYINNFDYILQQLVEQKELTNIQKNILLYLGIYQDDIIKLDYLLKNKKEDEEVQIYKKEKELKDKNVMRKIYPKLIKYFVNK